MVQPAKDGQRSSGCIRRIEGDRASVPDRASNRSGSSTVHHRDRPDMRIYADAAKWPTGLVSSYAGLHRFRPWQLVRCSSVPEVRQAVAQARRAGLRVRPLGSGHSWSPCLVTDDVSISVDGLQTDQMSQVSSIRRGHGALGRSDSGWSPQGVLALVQQWMMYVTFAVMYLRLVKLTQLWRPSKTCIQQILFLVYVVGSTGTTDNRGREEASEATPTTEELCNR